MDERVNRFVEAVTAGLRGDPELRLAARGRLLDEIAGYEAEQAAAGVAADLRTDAALLALGPRQKLTALLTNAHRPRLVRRTLARWCITLLLPVVLLVAVWVGYSGVLYVADVGFLLGIVERGPGLRLSLPRLPGNPAPEQYLEELTSRTPPKAQPGDLGIYDLNRRHWMAHPENTAYLGYYANSLFMGGYANPRYEPDIRLGLTRDPRNAQYHYLLACSMLKRAVKMRILKKPDPATGLNYTYDILDRKLLDAAMREFRAGLAKPDLRRYHSDVLQDKYQYLPPPLRVKDSIAVLAFTDLIPELANYRQLVFLAPWYAQLLSNDGRTQEALPYLDAWRQVSRQLAGDADYTIDLLCVTGYARTGSPPAATLYTKIKRPQQAAKARAILSRITVLRTMRRSPFTDSPGTDADLLKHGGITATYLSYWQPYTTTSFLTLNDLTPARQVEYTLFEQAIVGVVLLILAVVLLCFGWTAVSWRIELRGSPYGAPMLVHGAIPWVGLLAGLLPVALYLVYTRVTGWAEREYSVEYHIIRALIEAGMTALLLLGLPYLATNLLVRRRCRALGLPLPTVKQELGRKVLSLALALFVLAGWGMVLLAWSGILDSLNGSLATDVLRAIGKPVSLAILIAETLIALGLLIRQFRKTPLPFGLYYATLARTVLPVYAMLTLLLAFGAQPLLVRQEIAWLRKDHVVFPRPGGYGLSVAEERVIQDYRAAMLQALQ